MVCCCGSCKQNGGENSQKSADKAAECVCPKCPKLCWKERSEPTQKPPAEKHALEEFATFPASVPLNTKQLSKFGTPSKNYAWMQTTNSNITTTSLDHIGTYTSSYQNVYDWLEPDVDPTSPPFKVPGFMDIAEGLAYVKKPDSSRKSAAEERILLDAVCDAILQDHEDTANYLLDELQLTANHTTRDDNIANQSKADAYTKLSPALINTEDIGIQYVHNMFDSTSRNISTEDVGVQWFRKPDLQSILEQPDAKALDRMMNSIMDSIFADSTHSLKKPEMHKNTEDLENKDKAKNPYDFIGKDSSFTKTGLLPHRRSATARRSIKRTAAPEIMGKKKFKQESEQCLASAPPEEPGKIGNFFSKIDDIVCQSQAKTAEIQKALHSASSNSVGPLINGKRNYPMSSDNFKGMLYEPKKFTFHLDSAKHSHLGASEEPQECAGSPEDNRSETQQEATNSVAKLSIASFVVCDKKSEVNLASGGSRKVGKRPSKKVVSKASLIPVRK